jgi:hypothetical protein
MAKALRLGGATDYTEFEADGTMVAKGAATTYRDELQNLLIQLKNNPSDKIEIDIAEGSVNWKTTAGLDDYAVMNVQLNHDRLLGSHVFPHLHFWQAQNNMPNFLFQYRWQTNNLSKTTAWTYLRANVPAFTYVSGTLNQIARTVSGIAAPDDGEDPPVKTDNLSDILQLRIIRDTANASGEFTGADPYTVAAAVMNVDVHIELDMIGSRQEIIK